MGTRTAIPTEVRYRPPALYAKQRAAIHAPARYAIIEASSKSGKTYGCMDWLLQKAMAGRAGQHFWWVAPIFAQALMVFDRYKMALPKQVFTSNETKLCLTLGNGAQLVFKGADHPDSLYGEDVYAAVMDEATRCKEEAWHALRTTLTATRGPVRIIGNVKGRKNWAYHLARRAEAGEPDMAYARITAHDAVAAGVLQADEVEDARRQLPEAVFRELYLAEASDDEGNPFGLAAIRARVVDLSDRDPVAWGIDLAKSHDWTVAIGLDSEGRTCRFERWQGPWQDTIRRILSLVGEDVTALVDSTGVGDPVLEALQHHGQNFLGYKFTQPSKQQLMEGLAVAIQQGAISYPAGPIVSELEAFEYVYSRTGVHYCIGPETKVLTGDLRWIEAAKLAEGDMLLAFDEESVPGRKTRRWRSAIVTHAAEIIRPCYLVRLADGTETVASQEHRWLVGLGNTTTWRRTDTLRAPSKSQSPRDVPSRLVRLLTPWSTDESYEAGYLAAAFDGEGHIAQSEKHSGTGHNARLGFAQLENPMADQVRAYLLALGFQWAEHLNPLSRVLSFGLTGRRGEFLRFLGQIRPRRLLGKFDPEKLGVLDATTIPVIEVEYLGERPVIALGTSTGTFVADGLASHNSAPEGMHDDCVCALALAWQQARTRVDVFYRGGASRLTADEQEQCERERQEQAAAEFRATVARVGYFWPGEA